MDLQLDSNGNVIKILRLHFDNKNYDIAFIDGSHFYAKGMGRISQQCANFPVIHCTLSDAHRFVQQIADALAMGTDPYGEPIPARSIGCSDRDQFKLCFYDTAICLFDVMEYVRLGSKWINDGGIQLSEMEDPNSLGEFGDKIESRKGTVTLVTPSVPFKLISPIGFKEEEK